MVVKYLLLIFTIELFMQKAIKHRFHSFFLNILEHSCIFFKSDILTVNFMFEKLVNKASNFCSKYIESSYAVKSLLR